MQSKFLALLICIVPFIGHSQYHANTFVAIGENPRNLNHHDELSVVSLLQNYSGYNEILSAGDTGWSSQQPTPFAFEFNGGDVDAFYASATGVLTFSSSPGTAPSENNTSLPSTQLPDSSICAWGLTLNGSNDGVVTRTFGQAPNRQHWVIWASATQPGTSGQYWAYWAIVLEEGSNRAFVVDMRTYGSQVALTVGVQIDQTEAYMVGESIGTQNLWTSQENWDSDDNSYYEIVPGVRPSRDVFNRGILSPNYYWQVGDTMSVVNRVYNTGEESVGSVMMGFSIDGGATTSALTISGLSIEPGDYYDLEIDVPIVPTTNDLGASFLGSNVVQVNGQADQVADNNLRAYEVMIHNHAVPRKILVEAFCSSTCPPCYPGNINMHDVLSQHDGDYARVDYQMSWPGGGDPYFTVDGNERRGYYGINAVPMALTDGQNIVNSQSYNSDYVLDALEVPTFLQINPTNAIAQPYTTFAVQAGQLVQTSKTVEVSISANLVPVMDYDEELVARIALIEDITYNNAKTNGETEFYAITKKMLPDAGGSSLPPMLEFDTTVVSESYMFIDTYRLPNNSSDLINDQTEHSIEEWTDLSMVLWVQDDQTKEVIQVEKIKVDVADTISNLSIETINGHVFYHVGDSTFSLQDGELVYHGPAGVSESLSSSLRIYPNPTTDRIYIQGSEDGTPYRMYNTSGKMVLSGSFSPEGVDVSQFKAGMYFITLGRGAASSVKSFVVQ